MQQDAEYRVESVGWPTPVIAELWLSPHMNTARTEGVLAFQPGQYILLNDVDYRVPPRSYSIANAPRGDGMLSLLVTRVEGGETSGWAVQQKPGDIVSVSGPFGTFVIDDDARPELALLAAGSGFAPVRSLIESTQQRGRVDEVVVAMSARCEEHVIDAGTVSRLENTHSGFTFLRTLTRTDGPPPIGRLPAQLAALVPDIAEREVFASGPPGFVRACADEAREAGVPGTRIHTEEFYFEPHPWTA